MFTKYDSLWYFIVLTFYDDGIIIIGDDVDESKILG